MMTGIEDFQPVNDAEWPDEIARLRDGFAGRLNVYRVMAHNPALVAAWENFRNYTVLHSTLGAELSEIVIIRTGYRRKAPYEIAHHIVRGRAAGLSDGRIAALCTESGPSGGDDRLLAGAVDELVLEGRLAPESVAGLTARLGKEGVMDVIATVGLYTTLSFIVNSFATPVDGDIVASLEAQPFEGFSLP
ncbi:MAG: carboxymuconolactone decarboxylase family protein [Brucellaceae bacterium]|nr:carboxymuconolactone decarboxylase family protein [Brucellaceae bacterium]